MINSVEYNKPDSTHSVGELISRFSYSELSSLTGLTRKQISKLIKGRCAKVQLETVKKLANGLGVELDLVINYLDELNKNPVPYTGGKVVGQETIDIILSNPNKTTRELENELNISRETVSIIRRYGAKEN